MDAGSGREAATKSLLDILVGIHAGVIGGMVMLTWFALVSPLIGDPWWRIPNLLAWNYFSERSVLQSAGMATWFGAAVQLTGAGLVGAINGVLTPGGRLFGLAVAAAWYLLCYLFVWKRIAPGLLVYASQPVLVSGYFLFGSVLGWHQHMVGKRRG